MSHKGHQAKTFTNLYISALGVFDVSRIVCINQFYYADIS